MVVMNDTDDGGAFVQVSGRLAKRLRDRADEIGTSPNRLLLRLLTRCMKLCAAANAIRHGQPLSRSGQYYVRQEARNLGITTDQFIAYVSTHLRSHPWALRRKAVLAAAH